MDALTIVTGGAGFIGSHLVEQLVARGERVRVVERPGADAGHLPAGVEVVRADIRDPAAVAAAMQGARWVYHLAANPNLWARDRGEFDAVNHRGTVHVLDAALAAGAERVLHTSTESILTCARDTGPIAEDVEIALADAVGPYCRSKLRAENEALARARSGRPVVVANPTMPVGPGDRGMSPPTRLIRDFCRGQLPARMDCTLNLVDVRDVALGLIRTLEPRPAGAALPARRREPDPARPARVPVRADRGARPALARPLSAGAGGRGLQRALGRSGQRPSPKGNIDRCSPDPEDDAFRPLAEPGRAGPATAARPPGAGRCRRLAPRVGGPRARAGSGHGCGPGRIQGSFVLKTRGMSIPLAYARWRGRRADELAPNLRGRPGTPPEEMA